MNAVGPVLAAEFELLARNETARRPDVKTVTVEVVRPLDAEMKLEADADLTRAVPTTGAVRIDIRM